MKNPPILISVLGFFATLAGFGFLFYGLRAIGFDWFGVRRSPGDRARRTLGMARDHHRHHLDLRGVGLWALQPWARCSPCSCAASPCSRRCSRSSSSRDRRRLRDGGHAGPDPVVPQHRRGQGGLRRGRPFDRGSDSACSKRSLTPARDRGGPRTQPASSGRLLAGSLAPTVGPFASDTNVAIR